MGVTLAQRIIRAARAELGVREDPPGSNRGPRVCEYQRHDWITSPECGYPWCVSFAWGYIVWHRVLARPNPYPTASVEQLERWARAHGWAVPGPPKLGDLCCLNHGQHVTIYYAPSTRRGYFAGIGGNQSDAVRISEYPLASITTIVRVPARLAPPPSARRPRYEVVRGLGERSRVVYVAADPGKIGDRVERLLRHGARHIRVRPRRKEATP